MAETLRESRTTCDGVSKVIDSASHHLVLLLLTQHGESAEQRKTRVNQSRQLTGKDHQNLTLNATTDSGSCLALCLCPLLRTTLRRAGHSSLTGRSYLSRIKPALTKLGNGIRLIACRNRSGRFFPLCIQGNLFKVRHISFLCSLRS